MPLVLYSLRELVALSLFSESSSSSSSSAVARWLELMWFETNIGRQAGRHIGTQEARQGAGLLIVKPLLDFSNGGPS